MNRKLYILLLAYAVWQCQSLLTAWRDAPLEHGSGFLFLLWILPLLQKRVWQELSQPFDTEKKRYVVIATLLLMLGILDEMNLLCYMGLAALLGVCRSNRVWLLTALVWMPIFSWGFAMLSPLPLFMLRLGLILLGVGYEFSFRVRTREAV